MIIVLAVVLYGSIPVIPLGWQIYVKAKGDEIWIIDYNYQLSFCYIKLRKS